MEQKKTHRADIDQRRTTGFLLGLIFVLSLFYVSLEWNTTDSGDDISPIDLDELMHESELVPMSNEELTSRIEEKQEAQKAEQLHVVDDQVELQPDDVEPAVEGEGDDDEQLLAELQEEDDKALASLNVDPNNPLNFHIVEDLPKYPGGAVEFMKWLTQNLKYPPSAQQKKIKGRVVVQFVVNKDGTLSDLQVVQPLEPACDAEVMRVLKSMPQWKAGMMNAKPCRTMVCIPIVFNL